MTSTAAISHFDRQKMIEQCDKEMAMIESEFEMLARQNFVEFVHKKGQPALPPQ